MTIKLPQTLIGVGTLVLAAVMAVGATQISSDAGYGGVGPNFVPWVVAAALAVGGLAVTGTPPASANLVLDTRPHARLTIADSVAVVGRAVTISTKGSRAAAGLRSLTCTPPTLEELFLRHYTADAGR